MVDLPDTMLDLPNILPNTMVELPKTMVDLPNTIVDLPNTMVFYLFPVFLFFFLCFFHCFFQSYPVFPIYSSLFFKFHTRRSALIALAFLCIVCLVIQDLGIFIVAFFTPEFELDTVAYFSIDRHGRDTGILKKHTSVQ